MPWGFSPLLPGARLILAAEQGTVGVPASDLTLAAPEPALAAGAAAAPDPGAINTDPRRPLVADGGATVALTIIAAPDLASASTATVAAGEPVALTWAPADHPDGEPGWTYLATPHSFYPEAAASLASGMQVRLPPSTPSGGVGVDAPTADLAVAPASPALATGCALALLNADTVVTTALPTVATGLAVFAPAIDVALASDPPQTAAGASAQANAAAVVIASLAPNVATGAAISSPATEIAVAVPTPDATSSTVLTPPGAGVALASLPPTVTSGPVGIDAPPATIGLVPHEPAVVIGPYAPVAAPVSYPLITIPGATWGSRDKYDEDSPLARDLRQHQEDAELMELLPGLLHFLETEDA